MSEYFDKDKFTGDAPPPPPQPPRQRKNPQDEWEWLKWPLVIILFSVGLWPLGIIALAYFSQSKKKSRARRAKTLDRDTQERVERALRQAEERIAQAQERVEREFARAERPTAAQETIERALRQAEERVAQAQAHMERESGARSAAAQEPMQKKHESAAAKHADQKKTADKKAAAKPEKQKKEKTPGMVLRIIGICLLAIGAIISLDFAASSLQGYYTFLEDLFAGLGFLASGGIMLGRSEYLSKMSRRTKRYILAIGTADSMPLDEIAKRVNRTVAQTKKELENLIEKGYLGEDAYIDHEHGCFARFGAVVRKPAVVTEVPKEAEEGYSGILRNLRVANDRIPDAKLSEQIDRLEQISALIFKEVEAHPEKRERIRTFFDYYLPTTQKLLDTYAEFDEMGVEGENLTNAKERIEQMMDAIVEGFEHQLDELYRADALDVVSDIKVMESMLSRDTASAAKDFGYAKAKKPDAKDELKPQQLEM